MTLSIRNFAIECRLPQDIAADPMRSRDALELTVRSIRGTLPAILGHGLAGEAKKEGLAYIEKLEFEAIIGLDWSEDSIAREIARQILRSLWPKLGDSETLRFADEAEMIARFLLDLIDGAGFTRAWHKAFAGLKLLSASGIIRTLMVQDAATMLSALARLTPAAGARIIAAMNVLDARRALAALETVASRRAHDCLAIAEVLSAMGCTRLDDPVQRIALAVALFRQTRMAAGSASLRLAELLLLVAQSGHAADLQGESEESWPDATAFFETLGIELCSFDRRVLNSVDLQSLAAALKVVAPGVQTAASAAEYNSEHGGVWLLLPHILDQLEDASTASMAIAHCALAVAAGPDASAVWRDGTLRDALALSPDDAVLEGGLTAVNPLHAPEDALPLVRRPFAIRRRDVRHFHAAAAAMRLPGSSTRWPSRIAARALRTYAQRLPGFAESSFAYLWANLLSTRGTIRVKEDLIAIELSPPPLDIVWRLSGAGCGSYTLPSGRRVSVEVRR